MRYTQNLFCFLALFLSGLGLKAQTLEVGLMGGGAGYLGDLNQNSPAKISGINAGAFVKMNLDPYWALGLHYNYGKIKADDAVSDNGHFKARNLNFHTPVNELTLQLDFNFLEYFAGGGAKKFTPYIYTGIGGILFNPTATYNGNDYDLRFYATEGQTKAYKNYTITVPYGAGMKFRLKESWGLMTQIGYRITNTDYLDDVSLRYPGPGSWDGRDRAQESEFLSDPSNALIGAAGTQRGDFRKRDTYMFVGIGISYTFVSQKCYTF
ncbi:type IX secretion system protein PorG [Pedobacter psychroterrae]|uniref:DUF6089 domain-containing protein n=1 Tax=Pedobacter psychroterrae TaxID=2530453 RepID=A0A4R0NRV6_9SPHI|nr:DUF6089 family protein [Pedobacter psychroterrae]TCD03900.1 hypothetical protein EZ437_08115 [Pedobacter psychroterrae]